MWRLVVFTRLRHGRRASRALSVHLGRADLATLDRTVREILQTPSATVVLTVDGFDYFDLDSISELTTIAENGDGRVLLVGLDSYAAALRSDHVPAVVDVRPRAERAVVLLAGVAVVTCIVDSQILDDESFEAALALANASDRTIVTIDLRVVAELSPAQALSIAELSADLYHDLRQLILVNAGRIVAGQLERAGLTGGLRLAVDDLI